MAVLRDRPWGAEGARNTGSCVGGVASSERGCSPPRRAPLDRAATARSDVDVMNRLQAPSLGTTCLGRTRRGGTTSRASCTARASTIPAALGVIVVATVVGGIVGAVAGYAGGRVDEVAHARGGCRARVPVDPPRDGDHRGPGAGLKQRDAGHDPRVVAGVRPAHARPGPGDQSQRLCDVGESPGRRGLASSASATDVVPNASPPIVVKATLDMGNAMVLIAALSFLGLGAVPPEPEWGAMIAAGRTKFEYWWVATFPGLAILSVVLGFNFLGDGLQDWLNPRLRKD